MIRGRDLVGWVLMGLLGWLVTIVIIVVLVIVVDAALWWWEALR